MSDSGNPPQDPYGKPDQSGQPQYGQPSQPQYGQSGQPAYGQPAYGQPQYGQPGYGAPAVHYAHWGKRVAAYLIDMLVVMVGYLPAMVGSGISSASDDGTSTVGGLLMLVGVVAAIAIFVWNTCLKGGRTGWSIGKGVMGIRLISESTGQPIGAGMAFVRYLAHIIDALPCYLGYLWPLWDAKRQTFSDKLVGTIVVEQPQQG